MAKKKSARGGPREGAGRTPTDGEGYGQPLYIRVKPSQHARWLESAAAESLPLSEWVRRTLDAASS